MPASVPNIVSSQNFAASATHALTYTVSTAGVYRLNYSNVTNHTTGDSFNSQGTLAVSAGTNNFNFGLSVVIGANYVYDSYVGVFALAVGDVIGCKFTLNAGAPTCNMNLVVEQLA